MGLKLSPLKTSFLATVQVLVFHVGENDKKITFHIFVNFLKTLVAKVVLIYIVEGS